LICILPLPSIKIIFSSLFLKYSACPLQERRSGGLAWERPPLNFQIYLTSSLSRFLPLFPKKAQIIMLFFSNKCYNHKKLGLGLSFTFGSRYEIRSIVTKGRGNELQLQVDNHSILCEDINLQRYNAGILCVKL